VALAASAAAGTAAATQTVHLGADAKETTPISASALAAQKAKLAAADRSIDTALAARPPALPKVPKFERLGEPTVPPVVVTRVVSLAPSPPAATTGDDSPEPDPGPKAPAPSAASPRPATHAPVDAEDDGGDDHASAAQDDPGEDPVGEDHPVAQDHPDDSADTPPEPDHGGD
jgi:hypothetical protein